jgi:hypothetical protein
MIPGLASCTGAPISLAQHITGAIRPTLRRPVLPERQGRDVGKVSIRRDMPPDVRGGRR